MSTVANQSALDTFHPCTRDWFLQAFQEPTGVQAQAWPEIAAGNSTLLLAPTGSGKTLAAFLAAIDRLFFDGQSAATAEKLTAEAKAKAKHSRAIPKVSLGIRVLYISPLKALGVDVDRNLRGPLAGLRAYAEKHEVKHWHPQVAVRSGDTSQKERASIVKNPPDVLITTPESLYLMLTSKSDAILKTVDTIIIDEIHALAGTKRGAHLMTTLERLERLRVAVDEQGDDDRHRIGLTEPDYKKAADEIVAEGKGNVRKRDRKPLQRIGLSATQRPLDEIAALLGGGNATADPAVPVKARPVTIVDASERRRFDLTIETPAEDRKDDLTISVDPFADDGAADDHHGSPYDDPMYQPGDEEIPIGSASSAPIIPSVWLSIHPRLVELIKANRSTMIFVNSRRLAERLATAINEEAEEEIALAHHGSIAKDIRAEIEDRLKRGNLPAMVATSSMELGIDMGAVDLVIQIEAPPSIASATQRIGRAGHQVGAMSTGMIFPKYKGDLVACTAATGAMLEGWVEETYYPRNPLDILAQQIVAIASRESIHIDELYATMRSAAPFFELPHSSFVGVLDLLSGRYPSDEFSELRPRVNWDRITGIVSPRKGAQRLAILNAGTIPDRGLYGVFLVGENGESGGRVGELDEEMVFECRPGDVFLLGASSWRVMDITRDRVEVVPAPGEPGRMPFWRGDGSGRPLEFGKAIGKLSRELVSMPTAKATTLLTSAHGLQESAAESLLGYLEDQKAATVELPTDQCIVIESFSDEVGDWRIVILSPYGSRVHAPWAMLVSSRMRKDLDVEVDVMWTDDGIVLRIPETHDVPDAEAFFPEPDEVEDELVREIGGTALFAAKFRENAARSLLLPRRNPAKRTPLWLQRKRSADLLKVASRFRNFPMLMETYRECLRDVFDMPGFISLLKDVKSRAIRIHQVRSEYPSPFAGAVLFNYVGNFIYDGDAPLAERRAQTLTLDHAQLRELLGTVDLREMFDADILQQLSLELQKLTDWKLRHADDLHGLLLDLGSLTASEIQQRCKTEDVESGSVESWLTELLQHRRAFQYQALGETTFAASEDAGKLRDALGIMPPSGLADAFLEPVQEALISLTSQYARTHGPFTSQEVAIKLGLGIAPILSALSILEERERIVSGEFLPGRQGQEWCDVNVLRQLKRRSLAALRKEVEPVEPDVLARFLPDWHGITRPRKGLDGLLDVIEQLQGAPLPASTLEKEILPARITGYRSADLDELCVQGEVIWRGFDSTSANDGRIGLFLTDHYATLAPFVEPVDDAVADELRTLLAASGGLFFHQITDAIRQFPNDLLHLLWRMVWSGELTNDTLTPLRSLRTAAATKNRSDRGAQRGFRSRRQNKLPGSEGRWTLLPKLTLPITGGSAERSAVADAASVRHLAVASVPSVTERQMAIANQLIERHGVLTKEMLSREEVVGGFSGLYPILKAMEEAGKVRRGYFVAGLGAAQFAAPGAEDQLRRFRDIEESDTAAKPMVLAATDPAVPWGNALSWPESTEQGRQQRVAGAKVIVWQGQLIGYLNRTREHLTTFLPADEVHQANVIQNLVNAVAKLANPGRSMLLNKIDGKAAGRSELKSSLLEVGFKVTSKGLLHTGRMTF